MSNEATNPPSCGKITCRSVARRKLYELEGVDDRVTFEGPAAEKGRQAEEGEYPREEPEPETADATVDDEVRELVENTEESDVDE